MENQMAKKKKTNTFGTSVNVRIPHSLHTLIVDESEKMGASMGTIVRVALLHYFKLDRLS